MLTFCSLRKSLNYFRGSITQESHICIDKVLCRLEEDAQLITTVLLFSYSLAKGKDFWFSKAIGFVQLLDAGLSYCYSRVLLLSENPTDIGH